MDMRNKMKLITLFVIWFSSVVVNARQLSPTEAQAIAKGIVKKNVSLSGTSKSLKASGSIQGSTASSAVYVFNADDGKGFAVIAGDDRVPSVLAYSDKSSFDMSNAPEGAKWMIGLYERMIEHMTSTMRDNTPAFNKSAIKSRQAVEPLIKTQWNQAEPYNNMCPVIGGSKTLTGCVATAMAQLLNYTKEATVTNTVEAYTTRTNNIAMPELAPRSWNWSQMDDAEIASLMLYCGQSVHMDYGIYESGAYMEEVAGALNRTFNSPRDYYLLSRSSYSDAHWEDMMHGELDAGNPLIYSGISSDKSAHCFVVDGYSGGLFHVNWGWGGSSDGYYSFYLLDGDASAPYILNQSMVTFRNDEPGDANPDYGVTIDGVNYSLRITSDGEHIATVIPLKGGAKYSGEVIIPEHVQWEGAEYIVRVFGSGAFVGCKDMTAIYIPSTIVEQAWSIFDGCENLNKVYIDDLEAFINLEVGGWWTGSPLWNDADLYIKGQLVTELVIPEGVTSLGYCKFAHCQSIERVILPSSLRTLGQYSFCACSNLKDVKIVEPSVTWVDFGAFQYCTGLREITLPSTLEKVLSVAFDGCYNLYKIKCNAQNPPKDTDGEFMGWYAGFAKTTLYVPDGSIDKYKSDEKWGWFDNIFPVSQEKTCPQIERVSLGDFDYELNIDEATADVVECRNNNIVVVPASIQHDGKVYQVKSIGCETFYGHYNGTAGESLEITVSPGIEKLGMSSFRMCSYDELKLPLTLKRIGHMAFQNGFEGDYGPNNKTLELPASVESIGREALANVNLNDLYVLSPNPPAVENNTFYESQYDKMKLHIPAGSKKKYASHPVWSKFSHIEVIGGDNESADYDVSINAEVMGRSSIKAGKMPLIAGGTIRNNGLLPVDKVLLKWSVEGETAKGEKEFAVNLEPDHTFTFKESIMIPVLSSAGAHNLNIEVSIVGNVDSDMSDNNATLAFETFDKGYYRVSLIEEFSSEYCPVSRAYLPLVQKGLQDSGWEDFAAVVTHHCGYEPDFLTLTEDYIWLYGGWGSYTPAWSLNRCNIDGDAPVLGVGDFTLISNYITSAQSDLCSAVIGVNLEIKDGVAVVKTAVEKEAGFNVSDGYDYITVMLLEDSIPSQTDPENYIFNNVPRHIFTGHWGDDVIWKGDICGRRYSVSLSSDWNVNNLKAVAFLHRYNPYNVNNCQVYTAGSSALPQYGSKFDDSVYEEYVPKKSQSISWEEESYDLTTNVAVKLHAVASSGLPVAYVIESGDADILFDELTPKADDYIVVRAEQSGNNEYKAAEPVTRSFNSFTAIESILMDNNGELAIYTLQGIRIYTNIKDLHPGMYIINGKKVMIK